jgi:HlyD family secretion protein
MMAGTEMMRVADMNRIEAIVDVGENDIPKVHLGDSANIEIDAYNNRKFKGIVTQIASSTESTSSSTTSSSSVSSNDVTNYKVHIRLSPDSYKDLINRNIPKNLPFRPGMSASADIQTNTHQGVLSVPINSVTTRDKNNDNTVNQSKDSKNADQNNNNDNNDQNAKSTIAGDLDEVVFVVQKGDTVKKVKVKTDIQDINYIEITNGLNEGDQVITGPYGTINKTLKDGTRIQIVPKEKLFETKSQ